MILQVGVKVLLHNDQDEFLFLRRSQDFKPGPQKWDIPGGRIEINETLYDALAREVSEETGLRLAPNVQLLDAQDIFASDKDLHVVRLTYSGEATGTVSLSAEHDTFEWMSLERIGAESHVDSYLREVINKNAENHFAGGRD